MYLIDYIQKRMVQTNLRQIIQKLTRNTYRNIYINNYLQQIFIVTSQVPLHELYKIKSDLAIM